MPSNQEKTTFNTLVKCENCGYQNYETYFDCIIRVNQASKKSEKDYVCPRCKSYDLIYPKTK